VQEMIDICDSPLHPRGSVYEFSRNDATRPTAKSQMSIISCTSLLFSEDFPGLKVTSWPSSCFCSRSAIAKTAHGLSLTGPGLTRHFRTLPARARSPYCSRRPMRYARCDSAPSIGEICRSSRHPTPFAIEDAVIYVSKTKLFGEKLHNPNVGTDRRPSVIVGASGGRALPNYFRWRQYFLIAAIASSITSAVMSSGGETG